MAGDPTTWIVIPEFNVSPADVGGKGFDRHIFAAEIDRSIQGPIWNIICSMRSMAEKRFNSLADVYAANDRVLASGKHAEKATEDEWFAWGYVYIFEALERWHHTYPFNMLEASTWLAHVADQALAMFTGGPHDPQSINDLRSQFAKKGAASMLANSPKQREKQLVRERWEDWQARPIRYKGKAEFARGMLAQYKTLVSQRVIERWCLEWQGEAD
jgi:hypothetical protein